MSTNLANPRVDIRVYTVEFRSMAEFRFNGKLSSVEEEIEKKKEEFKSSIEDVLGHYVEDSMWERTEVKKSGSFYGLVATYTARIHTQRTVDLRDAFRNNKKVRSIKLKKSKKKLSRLR